jgi:hypothetical protein
LLSWVHLPVSAPRRLIRGLAGAVLCADAEQSCCSLARTPRRVAFLWLLDHLVAALGRDHVGPAAALLAAHAWLSVRRLARRARRIALFWSFNDLVAALRHIDLSPAAALVSAFSLVSGSIDAVRARRVAFLRLLDLLVAADRRPALAVVRALARIALGVLAVRPRRIAILCRLLHDLVSALLGRLDALARRVADAWRSCRGHARSSRRIALLARIKDLVAALLGRRDHANAGRSPVLARIDTGEEAVLGAVIVIGDDLVILAAPLADARALVDLVAFLVDADVWLQAFLVAGPAIDADERHRDVRILWPAIAVRAPADQVDPPLRRLRSDRDSRENQHCDEHDELLHHTTLFA